MEDGQNASFHRVSPLVLEDKRKIEDEDEEEDEDENERLPARKDVP
jgi:hypothetical protein